MVINRLATKRNQRRQYLL